MRRLALPAVTLAALTALAVPVLLALPVTTTPRRSAHPVPPSVQNLAVSPVAGPASGSSPGLVVAAASYRAASSARPAATADPGTRTVAVTPEQRTRTFSTLGVTWTAGPPAGQLQVQVRTRTAGAWTGWQELDSDNAEGPDPGSSEAAGRGLRGGTAPLFVGRSDGVEVRVVAPAGVATADLPQDLKVALVDPGTSAADRSLTQQVPTATATAATRQPAVISRAEWGADESLRREAPSYSSTIKVGFVHHTASSGSYTPEEAAQQIRGIYAYHVQSRGWNDIGYNFLVDRFGRTYEGRAGGIDQPVVGAHAGGFNTDTFGVALLGDFTAVTPPPATLAGVEDLLAWKLSMYGRDPLGKDMLTSAGGDTARTPAGTLNYVDVISGHRDTNLTECPGDGTYHALGLIRQAVAARVSTDPMRSIAARYAALGGAAGFLGQPLGPQTIIAQGAVQSFQGGNLYFLPGPGGGAFEVHGDILKRYLALGGPLSPLGFPVGDEGPAPAGRSSRFAGGMITWTGGTTRAVYGAIAQAWFAYGGPTGVLGMPLTDEQAVTRGRMSVFQGGRIYWSAATGAKEVQGLILEKYLTLKGPDGVLGLPTTHESAASTGRFSGFEYGVITWSGARGAHAAYGAISEKYARLGGATGDYGLVVSDEAAAVGGRVSEFERGRIYWSSSTGAAEVQGLILGKYLELGGPGGALGLPVRDEAPAGPAGRVSSFLGGDVYWSPATGSHEVHGYILNTLRALGGIEALGFPVTDEQAVAGGRQSVFERALLTFSEVSAQVTLSGR